MEVVVVDPEISGGITNFTLLDVLVDRIQKAGDFDKDSPVATLFSVIRMVTAVKASDENIVLLMIGKDAVKQQIIDTVLINIDALVKKVVEPVDLGTHCVSFQKRKDLVNFKIMN